MTAEEKNDFTLRFVAVFERWLRRLHNSYIHLPPVVTMEYKQIDGRCPIDQETGDFTVQPHPQENTNNNGKSFLGIILWYSNSFPKDGKAEFHPFPREVATIIIALGMSYLLENVGCYNYRLTFYVEMDSEVQRRLPPLLPEMSR